MSSNKATISNSSGLVLSIPKYGNGLMLFMEWLADAGNCRHLEKVKNNRDAGGIEIRMFGTRSTFIEAKDYINENL